MAKNIMLALYRCNVFVGAAATAQNVAILSAATIIIYRSHYYTKCHLIPYYAMCNYISIRWLLLSTTMYVRIPKTGPTKQDAASRRKQSNQTIWSKITFHAFVQSFGFKNMVLLFKQFKFNYKQHNRDNHYLNGQILFWSHAAELFTRKIVNLEALKPCKVPCTRHLYMVACKLNGIDSYANWRDAETHSVSLFTRINSFFNRISE